MKHHFRPFLFCPPIFLLLFPSLTTLLATSHPLVLHPPAAPVHLRSIHRQRARVHSSSIWVVSGDRVRLCHCGTHLELAHVLRSDLREKDQERRKDSRGKKRVGEGRWTGWGRPEPCSDCTSYNALPLSHTPIYLSISHYTSQSWCWASSAAWAVSPLVHRQELM